MKSATWRRFFARAAHQPACRRSRHGDRPSGRGARAANISFEPLESRNLLTAAILPPEPFDAVDFDQAAAITGNDAAPTDAEGVVGRNHWLSVAGGALHWRSRDGLLEERQPLITPSGASGFFAALTPVGEIVRARVAYDRTADRFIVAVLERVRLSANDPANVSRILLAASAAGDPSGPWQYASIDAREIVGGNDTWADDLDLAVNGGVIYLSASLRSFAGPSPRVAGRLWVFDKAALYAGANPTAARYDPYASIATSEFPPLAFAKYIGDAPSDKTFLLGMGTASGGAEQLHAFGVENPLAALTFKARIVALGDVHDNAASFTGAVQPGAPSPLPTGGVAIANAVWRESTIYAVHTTIPATGPDAGQETVRWYRLNALLSFVGLNDTGIVGGEDLGVGTRTFDPAVAFDAAGAAYVSFYAANATMFPSSFVAERLIDDPDGFIGRSLPLFAGRDAFKRSTTEGSSLWTGGNSLAFDPVDANTLWSFAARPILRGSPSSADPPESGRWSAHWSPFVAHPGSRTVRGVAWDDVDGDALRDPIEQGIAGSTIYLDANDNGILDAGEPRTITRGDDPSTPAVDETGSYEFLALPPRDYVVRQLPLEGWSATFPPAAQVVVLGPTPLVAIARNLAAQHGEITGLVPDRYAFTGGDVGTAIADGGNDMYDIGNILNTNLASSIPYTNGAVLAADATFGPGSHYFTAKHPALFALGVSGMNVDYFEITGETGADGAGLVDGTVITFSFGARDYRAYLKRTTGAGDPSIHHIVIVPVGGAMPTQVFSSATNSDQHRVFNLVDAREFYYLLVARRNGVALTNGQVQQAAEAFLRTLPVTGLDLLNVNLGARRTTKLDGFVFRDQDGDSEYDALEPGLAGWSVYADMNGNALPDAGEPAGRSILDDPATAAIDESGQFVLSSLPTGNITVRMAPQGGWRPTAGSDGIQATVAPLDLAASRDAIATDPQAIVGRLVGRYDFLEGETGTAIVDGGGMYETGNLLSTNLAGEISYTNGQVVDSDPVFGPGSRYFTAKTPGLFVLSAENVSIESFSIAGATAAASHGQVDGGKLSVRIGGEAYTLFVKRIYDGGSPSVNHLILVRGAAAASSQSFPLSATNDAHQIVGLAGASEVHYLLTALEGGAYLTDAAAMELAVAFLTALVRTEEEQGGITFGNYPGGTISGVKWNDLDGDRFRDAGEPGLGGWTIYVDANDNLQLDPGETSAITEFDDPSTPGVDETGRYTIEGVNHATHRVREVSQNGWNRTFPVADAHDLNVGFTPLSDVLANLGETGNALASLIPGRFDFTDGVSGNSINDGGGDMFDSGNQLVTTRGTANRTISYSDNSIVGASNRFGDSSTYFTSKFPGLFILAAKEIEIDAFRVDGGLGADGEGALDSKRIVLVVGGQAYTVFVKRVYGAPTPSVNHLIVVPGIGAGITETIAATTFDDLHRVDGLAQVRELYYLMFGSTAGAYVSDLDMTIIATAFLEQVSAGFDAANVNFANRETANNAVVRGSVWNDDDADGTRDSGEVGLANWTVFLDANGNGVFDASEPTAVTLADDPATLGIDDTGAYQFVGLSAGTYSVTVLPAATHSLTSPAMNFRGSRVHSAILVEGEVREGLDFGARTSRPGILVRGGSNEIRNGESSTSTDQGTYFGYADVSGDTASYSYMIYNTGDAPLQLTGNPPVQLTGTGAADYTVTTQPNATLPPGGSANFSVRFDPALTGTRRATITIGSNAPAVSPYTFTIEGIGAASATVLANNDTYTIGEDTILGTGLASVVPARASWLYFEDMRRTGPNAVYPTDATPADTWRDRGYNTAVPSFGQWKGPTPAPFGVGVIDGFQAPVSPLSDAFIPPGGATAVTALFRINFTLTANMALATSGVVRALCDDACIGYINGVEVFRERMLDGPASPTAEATEAGNETQYITYNVDLAARGVPLFADANNVFAVEVHQQVAASTDLGFDATLNIAGGPAGVLANDTRPANIQFTVATLPTDATTGQAVGSLLIAADNSGNFTYTPPRDYAGTVRFRYVLTDNSSGQSSNAQATIIVSQQNDPPLALNDVYGGPADRPLVVAAGSPLVEATDHRWWYFDEGVDQSALNPQWKLGPTAGFSPGAVGWKGPSTSQLGFGEGDEQTPVRNSQFANTLTHYAFSTFDVAGEPDLLIVELKRDDGAAIYINGVEVIADNLPNPHPHSAPSLANANDDGQTFHRFAIPTAGLALRPTLNTIAVEIHQWELTTSDMSFDLRLYVPALGLLANDEDRDNPPTSLSVVNVVPSFDPQTVGTLEVAANGSFVFTPANAAVGGNFTFTYQSRDIGGTLSPPATVTLSITPTNLGPVIAQNDLGVPEFTTMEDTPLAIDAATGPSGAVGIGLLANDTHPGEESAGVTLEIVGPPASGGTVVLSTVDRGGFTYTPPADFDGIDSFSYRVFDGVSYSNVAIVNIVVQSADDPPVAHDDEFTLGRDSVLTVADPAQGILANDVDVDEDLLEQAEVVSGQEPQFGSLTLHPDGTLAYTPNPGFVGVDRFQYTVSAAGVRSAAAIVTLNVEESTCLADFDLNDDARVDRADLAAWVDRFFGGGANAGDFNCDGDAGVADAVALGNAIAQPSPSPAAVVAAGRDAAATDRALANLRPTGFAVSRAQRRGLLRPAGNECGTILAVNRRTAPSAIDSTALRASPRLRVAAPTTGTSDPLQAAAATHRTRRG